MNNKAILIILIFVLVGLITFLGGYLIAQRDNRSQVGLGRSQTANISRLNRFSTATQLENEDDQPTIQGRTLYADKFKRISTVKVLGPAIAEDGRQVIYFEKSSGKILASDFYGQNISTVSGKILDNITGAVWSKNGYEVIVAQNSRDGQKHASLNLHTNQTAMLDKRISSVVWADKNSQIVYSFLDKETGEGNISMANPDGLSFKVLLPTRADNLKIDRVKDGLISFHTPGANDSLFLLSVEDGRLEKVLESLKNLKILWSPDGSKLLYSHEKEEGVETVVMNLSDQNGLFVDIITEADKCVWTADSLNIFCGGKKNAGSREALYKMDLNKKEFSLIYEPGSLDGVEIKTPLLSPVENFLFFINAADQYLYAINLET